MNYTLIMFTSGIIVISIALITSKGNTASIILWQLVLTIFISIFAFIPSLREGVIVSDRTYEEEQVMSAEQIDKNAINN